MRAWGQVEGRRVEAPEQGGGGGREARTSPYGGVDWWPDCGLGQEALDRHAARGQHACKICLEGARRREQERVEQVSGVPLPHAVLLRQLAALGTESGAVRGYHASMRAACGTYSARRRHRRRGEICATCGVKEGDYE